MIINIFILDFSIINESIREFVYNREIEDKYVVVSDFYLPY